MRKFYYLNSSKEWMGPYLYPQILLLALTNKIGPNTFLWHNKLTKDIGAHPSHSIYARLQARTFRFLPVYVFGQNLQVLAINTWRSVVKKFRKKDDWQAFAEKPIKAPLKDQAAVEVFLIPSFTAIHDFAAPGNFRTKLIYIDLSGDEDEVKTTEYPINLSSDQFPGIKYEILMENPPTVGGVAHQESYGLHRMLLLTGEAEKLVIERNSAYDFSTESGVQPQTLRGRFNQASQVSRLKYKQCYNRLIIKTGDTEFIGLSDPVNSNGTHLFDHDPFNVVNSAIGLSFHHSQSHTDISFNGQSFRLYSVSKNIVIIDGLTRCDLTDFKKYAEVIRQASALLTGKFYGGEISYVSSDDPQFEDIDGVTYQIDKESVLSTRKTIDLRLFRMTFKSDNADDEAKYKNIDTGFHPDIFAELCRALYENESLLHAAALVISAMGNYNPLQQGALYSVALEALTEELGERKSKELKPITDKEVSRALATDLLTVITKYDADLSEDAKAILTKKINSINSPTNRDKLVKTFLLYGVKLDDKDIDTIDKRNDYLHGKNPLSSSEHFELTQISLRLHTLIVSLLFKVAGYSGHVINLDQAVYATNEDKLFEMIQKVETEIQSLTEKLKSAVQTGNMAEFDEIKSKLLEVLDGKRLTNYIRIL